MVCSYKTSTRGNLYIIDIGWGYYNHALRQVANFCNEVILCVQRYATMFVQVYAKS